jgi:hypothetical protein
MLNLDDIINSSENLEVKRALAVKMILHDFSKFSLTAGNCGPW